MVFESICLRTDVHFRLEFAQSENSSNVLGFIARDLNQYTVVPLLSAGGTFQDPVDPETEDSAKLYTHTHTHTYTHTLIYDSSIYKLLT